MELINWLNKKVPIDKQLHFLVSFFLVALFSMFVPLWIACLFVIVLNMLKESTDIDFDIYDIIAGCAGVLAALIIL